MTDDLPVIDPDPWTRFDMWAERSHAYIAEAIEIERNRGDNETTCAVADMLDHASYVARSLAEAAAPFHEAHSNDQNRPRARRLN